MNRARSNSSLAVRNRKVHTKPSTARMTFLVLPRYNFHFDFDSLPSLHSLHNVIPPPPLLLFRYPVGESVVSTNFNYPDWFGSPSSDALFLFSVSEPTDVVATTCSSQTSFRSRSVASGQVAYDNA